MKYLSYMLDCRILVINPAYGRASNFKTRAYGPGNPAYGRGSMQESRRSGVTSPPLPRANERRRGGEGGEMVG